MIAAELRHQQELLKILAKHPYTFYAYGSRTKGTQQKFSDLDLCYFEDIPAQELASLKNDLEESSLPFIVQLTDWQKASKDFRQLIKPDLVPIQASPFLKKIETNLWEQLCYPLKRLGFEKIRNQEIRMTNAILNYPILNVVCATNTTEENFDQIYNKTISQFDNKAFSWWVGPSSQPTTIGAYLKNRGFLPKVREEAMFLPLKPFEQISERFKSLQLPTTPPCRFARASSTQQAVHFAVVYDHIDPTGMPLFTAAASHMSSNNSPYRLFVGYIDNFPAVIGALFFANGLVGVCNLASRESEDNGAALLRMLRYLLEQAQEIGATHATILSADQESTNLYNYLGFKTIGFFDHYEARPTSNPPS